MKTTYSKFIALITLLFVTQTLHIQAQIGSKGQDEFLQTQEPFRGIALNPETEIPDLTFDFNFNYINNALNNERFLKRAFDKASTKWYNRQVNDIIKPLIEQKLGKKFDNFNDAKDAFFWDSEFNNVTENKNPARNKYLNKRQEYRGKEFENARELKLLRIRRQEILDGNINNSNVGNIKVRSVLLKNIKNKSELTKNWDNIFEEYALNNQARFFNEAISIMARDITSNQQFKKELISLKNKNYNSRNYWDRLGLMQFLLNYDIFQEYLRPPRALFGEQLEIYNKYKNALNKAQPQLIENFVLANAQPANNLNTPCVICIPHPRVGCIEKKIEGCQEAKGKQIEDTLNATNISTILINNLIDELGITNQAQKSFLFENRNKSRGLINLSNYYRANGFISLRAINLTKSFVETLSNSSLSESEKDAKMLEAFNIFQPELNTTQIIDYKKELEIMTKYLKRAGEEGIKAFAKTICDNILPEIFSHSLFEVKNLYKLVRQERFNLKKRYVKHILFTTITSFKPVVQVALVGVGLHYGSIILRALPPVYVTPYITNILTRLGIPSSTAYTAFMHAKKFGIQTFAELEREFVNLGLTRTQVGVQFHHLIEQRFVRRPEIAAWLGSTVKNWKSIVLTPAEHQVFTNAWREAVSTNNMINAGWTGAYTRDVTLEQVKMAAREIYRNYPEILRALGL